ncbi:unnamed protein product [Schistocephalus solidus]|uniref:C2H2-type domain-containing protein n=1 Tax=Schistocephalus solidus TaxID=70667 RepID=A0A183SV38_SCHSO|nr:unnamed protein product [Schistocephalus solidus]
MNDSPPASTDYSCPQCTRKFTSRIGLLIHLRIHRTEAGEPVPGALTYSRRARLHCPHCSRTFTHRMSLSGHMRLHDNLRTDKKHLFQNDQPELSTETPPIKPISLIFEDDVNFWYQDYDLQPEVDYADAPYGSDNEGEPREEEVPSTKFHSTAELNHTSHKETEISSSFMQPYKQQTNFNISEPSYSPHHPRYKYFIVWIACELFVIFSTN